MYIKSILALFDNCKYKQLIIEKNYPLSFLIFFASFSFFFLYKIIYFDISICNIPSEASPTEPTATPCFLPATA